MVLLLVRFQEVTEERLLEAMEELLLAAMEDLPLLLLLEVTEVLPPLLLLEVTVVLLLEALEELLQVDTEVLLRLLLLLLEVMEELLLVATEDLPPLLWLPRLLVTRLLLRATLLLLLPQLLATRLLLQPRLLAIRLLLRATLLLLLPRLLATRLLLPQASRLLHHLQVTMSLLSLLQPAMMPLLVADTGQNPLLLPPATELKAVATKLVPVDINLFLLCNTICSKLFQSRINLYSTSVNSNKIILTNKNVFQFSFVFFRSLNFPVPSVAINVFTKK